MRCSKGPARRAADEGGVARGCERRERRYREDRARVVRLARRGRGESDEGLPTRARGCRKREDAVIPVSSQMNPAAGWIFPTEKGTLHKGSPLRDLLDAACTACGTKRRVTCHGLRHTANDLLRRITDGEVVRAILGHSTAAMTHHYSHVDEGEKRIAAMRVLEVVTGGKNGSERGDPGRDGGCDRVKTGSARHATVLEDRPFGAIAKW